MPVEGLPYDDYGIQCKFGRFGHSPGTLVNSTTVKCVTPNVQDNPESIYRETVPLVLAQNGQNYNEWESEAKYTFVGTHDESSFWPWILALVLIFIIIIALVLCLAIFLTKQSKFQTSTNAYYSDNQPYIVNRKPRGIPAGMKDERDRIEALNRERERVQQEELKGSDPFDPGTKNPYTEQMDPYR